VGAPAELAEMCDYIQIFVSDDGALLDVIRQMARPWDRGHRAFASNSRAALDESCRRFVERRGARFVEAPFTGSKIGAEKGELVFYVAGDEVALKEARPILEASSTEVIEIGEIGQGHCGQTGYDIRHQRECSGVGRSPCPDQSRRRPFGKVRGRAPKQRQLFQNIVDEIAKMIEGNFEPHFALKHMLKDMLIAAGLDCSHHLELAVTAPRVIDFSSRSSVVMPRKIFRSSRANIFQK